MCQMQSGLKINTDKGNKWKSRMKRGGLAMTGPGLEEYSGLQLWVIKMKGNAKISN